MTGLNPDDAENELIHALLDPLPKTGYLAAAVRRMTGHARHRMSDNYLADCAKTTAWLRSCKLSSRGRTKILLAALLGLAVAAAFIVPGAARRELNLMIGTQAGQMPDFAAATLKAQQVTRERILSRVSPAEGEFLFGDLAAQRIEGRWRALSDREPEDPGRHADAALGYLRGNGELPADFVAKGEALDPGNGWYAYLQGRVSMQAGRTERLDRGVGLLEKALAAPRFEDPTRATWDQRVALLPEEKLWADVVASARFVSREMPTPGHRFPLGPEFFPLKAATEREAENPARMNELARTWMDLFAHSIRTTRTREELASVLMYACSSGPAVPLGRSGQSGSGFFADLGTGCHAALSVPPTPAAPTSLLAAGCSTAPCHDPALTRPGIVAEWAMHERLIGWGSVLLLGFMLVVNLAVLQSHRGYDRLAERLGHLLRRSDHLLIFLVSLGLPLLFYAIATRLPGHGLVTQPLAQEKDPRFTLLAILHGAWILAVPLLALEATRWRLSVRGRALGMAGRGVHLGMVPLAMVLGSLTGATVLPAISSAWADPKLPMLGLATGLIFGALWLLVLVVWHFAAPREAFPERLLRLRFVFWPVLAALLITAAGMTALRQYEHHLVSINRFEKSPRTHAGNLTASDKEFLDTWKPKLLEEVRKARLDLDEMK